MVAQTGLPSLRSGQAYTPTSCCSKS